MIAIYALVFRILSGEKYSPASREDTKLWLALLASVPPFMGVLFPVAAISHNWPVFIIWLCATLEGVTLLIFWFLIMKMPGLKSISLLAIIGWGIAFGMAFYLNR